MISNIRCTRSITFHFKCQHISCTHISVAAAAVVYSTCVAHAVVVDMAAQKQQQQQQSLYFCTVLLCIRSVSVPSHKTWINCNSCSTAFVATTAEIDRQRKKLIIDVVVGRWQQRYLNYMLTDLAWWRDTPAVCGYRIDNHNNSCDKSDRFPMTDRRSFSIARLSIGVIDKW